MGFEPTTSAVTGRRSNQLSHRAKKLHLQNCTQKIYKQTNELSREIWAFYSQRLFAELRSAHVLTCWCPAGQPSDDMPAEKQAFRCHSVIRLPLLIKQALFQDQVFDRLVTVSSVHCCTSTSALSTSSSSRGLMDISS